MAQAVGGTATPATATADGKAWAVSGSDAEDFYFNLLTYVDLDVLLTELWFDGIHKEAKERFAYLHATFERDDCWICHVDDLESRTNLCLQSRLVCTFGSYDLSNGLFGDVHLDDNFG